MTTVFSFSIARLNNTEFTGLMLNLQRLMLDNDRESLGIPAKIFVDYNKLLQSLVDQVYNAGQNQLTALLREADDKRGRLYKKVRTKLTIAEFAEAGSSLLECRDVIMNDLLSKYTARVPQMAMQEKSAVLSGFVYDLRHKLTESQIEDLAIEDDIVRLETANNEFMEAYSARVIDKVNSADNKTAKLRQQLGDLYQHICIVLQYNANSVEADDKEMAELCQSTIAQLNVILAEAKQRLDARQRKNGESSEDAEPGAGGDGGGSNGDGTGGSNDGNGAGGSNGGSNTQGGGTSGDNQGGSQSGSNVSGDNASGDGQSGNNQSGTSQGGNTPADDGSIINGGNAEW